MSQRIATIAEAVYNPIMEYPSRITWLSSQKLGMFKNVYDAVVETCAKNRLRAMDIMEELSDDELLAYHLCSMATYGDVFRDMEEKGKWTECWDSKKVIPFTSMLVKRYGASIHREAFPEFLMKETTASANKWASLLEGLSTREKIEAIVSGEIKIVHSHSPRRKFEKRIEVPDAANTRYFARIAHLQVSGKLDEARMNRD